MSEHTDATEDRPDDDAPPDDGEAGEQGLDDEPQPWAKALPGDGDD